MIFLFFALLSLNAQTVSPLFEIGKFSQASSFSINPAGNIYVSDINKNEVYKLDTLGNVTESIGGYGWAVETFDEPVDIFSTTLNVYVTDRNNDRIQIFDKDLNYLSQFTTKNIDDSQYQFAYPNCSAVSNQGDLYILDSDNARILKYDLTGSFLLEIGNIDAGDFSLSSPLNFDITPDGRIFIIEQYEIIIFDQYGTGLGKLNSEMDSKKININYNHLIINNNEEIRILNLNNIENGYRILTKDMIELSSDIIETTLFNNKLYVLSDTQISVYDLSLIN